MVKKTAKTNKSIPANMAYKFINTLIFVGYVIMYPFEKIYGLLGMSSNFVLGYDFSKNLKAITKKIALYKSILPKRKPKPVKLKKPKTKKIPPAKKIKQKRRLHPALAFSFGMVFTMLFVLIPVYAYSWYKELPQPELLEQQANNKSTKIFDRKGRLLYEIYVDRKYDPVPLEQVPNHVVQATLAIEDASFYSHYGFDPVSIMRAAKATVVDDELQGGSTITQQLIKNVLLTPERTMERKVKELVLAIMVERKFTKDEILELYMNNIPYGGTAYGVESAAQKYFGKHVGELTLGESALLAGLPSAPSVYSPLQNDFTVTKARQKQVLDRMLELGYITKVEHDDALAQELVFAPQIEYIRAPHFVEYVRSELYKKYGQRTVDFGGLTVTTTLDIDLQDEVQKIVTDEVAKAGNLNFSNGAAVVLDTRTGGILAYVGSTNYFSEQDGKFDVLTALRQPGSSIKPITYALAFEKGLTPATTLNDSPITYQSFGEVYSPKNYDGKYHGTVSLRTALANSYNIPAVKLLNAVGVDDMVQLGKNLGFDYWTVGDGTYGLSVTLGGKEVRLLDLSNVYATFARGGVYKETTPFLSIKDIYGFEIHNLGEREGEQLLKPTSAYLITNILADNAARTPAFGSQSKLVVPGHTVAVKTGTTNDIRDNLTLGYTPSYTVGVWVGNNDNSPMSRVASGISGAAPIWNSIMTKILEGTPDEPFATPEGIIVVTDKACGRTEVFEEGSKIPKTLCVKKDQDKDKNNNDSDQRNNDDDDNDD